MQKIKDFFNNLNPETRRKVTIATIVGVLVVGGLAAYEFSGRGEKVKAAQQQSEAAKTHDISLNSKEVEQTIYAETKKILDAQDAKNRQFEENITKNTKTLETILENQKQIQVSGAAQDAKTPPMPADKSAPANAQAGNINDAKFFPAAGGKRDLLPKTPLPPMPGNMGNSAPGGPIMPPPPPSVEETQMNVIGDIGVVSGKSTGSDIKKNDKGESVGPGDKEAKNGKGDKKSFYLPPCFMPATLLTGVRAPTMGNGDKDPVPVLLRVKAPAVLPGRVTSQIQDCFITGETMAKLSDERAHVRLLSLSCVDKNKRAIIDQKVTGFVQDEDGVVGLSGVLTARFGSTLARSFIAGAFQGAGNALQSSSTTVQASSIGTTTTIDPSEVTKSALGGGLSTASKELQEFYMNLAKASMPVLEVGNSKPCTVIISQGVNLEVKEGVIK